MKRKQFVWSAVLPLVLAAVVLFAWLMSRGGDEMLSFLAVAVVGYPVTAALGGILGVQIGLHLPAIPLMAGLGYILAAAMGFSSLVGWIFASAGAVVTICGIIFAVGMYGTDR